jgi:hypothetical protein
MRQRRMLVVAPERCRRASTTVSATSRSRVLVSPRATRVTIFPASTEAIGQPRDLTICEATVVGGVFALTTVANTLFHVVFSVWDIRNDFGAGNRSPEELPVIIVIGTIGLLAALGIRAWLSDDKAPRGAIVLGVLAILSLPPFWCRGGLELRNVDSPLVSARVRR